jgi:F-type H+-transporting ATPase subunit epsilon
MSTMRDDAAMLVFKAEGAAPETIHIQGGFAEVSTKGLTVLAEHAEG